MTLLSASAWFRDINGNIVPDHFDSPPAQTLQPGEKTVFGFQEPGVGSSWDQAAIYWTFTDVNGGKHRADYYIDIHGNPSTYSNDCAPSCVATNATFYMTSDSDGEPNDIDAVLSHPAEATIDAKTSPAAAASVMKLFNQGTSQNYTPTTGLSFTSTDWKQASAKVVNTSNEPADLALSAGDTHQETTSIGLQLGWSASLGILGLVNTKLSASITGGHAWTTSDTTTNTLAMTIDPGHVGWVESSVTEATVTGDFTFTTPEGITYHVLNATVTEPGRGPNGEAGAVTWRPHEEPIGPSRPQSILLARHHAKPRPKPVSLCSSGGRGGGRCQGLRVVRGASKCTKWRPSARQSLGSPRRSRRAARRSPVCAHWLTNVADGTVVIDATTQPQAAAAAMALFPTATNTAFTATSNPLYTNTDQSQVSNSFENPSSYPHPVAGSFTAQHDYSSSWSLGGSVSSETTLSALGFADASVSVTFTASHEWVTSHSDSQSVTANVDPGFISWVEGYTRQVTFTGDYSFTANGVSYQVNNVSMTEPGNSESGPNAASTFIVINHKLNATARRRFARPGTVPRKQTASLIKK